MSKFHIGQNVYCLKYGEGVVIEVNNDTRYPIVVQFLKDRATYTADGIYEVGEKTPMLYTSKPEITSPKWQPEPSQWCLFWDETRPNRVLLRRFVGTDVLGAKYVDHMGEVFDNCIPFTGDVPKHLKGGENE